MVWPETEKQDLMPPMSFTLSLNSVRAFSVRAKVAPGESSRLQRMTPLSSVGRKAEGIMPCTLTASQQQTAKRMIVMRPRRTKSFTTKR